MSTATRKGRHNGTAGAAMDVQPIGPRLPREDEWWDVGGVPGFSVRLWVNFPTALWRQAIGADGATSDQQREALQRIVLEHNGWQDEQGDPYPLADAADFYEAIPNRLLLRLVQTIRAAQGTLPNFQMPTRRT